MHDWGQDLAALRERLDQRVQEAGHAAVRRRHQADERIAAVDTTIFDAPLDRTAVPDGAPAQYREVVDRFGAAELDWQTVMAGDTEDEGGRAMSVWMDRRLQQLEEVGKLVRRGIPVEDAYSEVTERASR